MAEGAISLPPGAFAAAKAGKPLPAPAAKPEAAPAAPAPKVEAKPKVELRKPQPKPEPAPEPGSEPEALPTAAEKKLWKLKDGDEEFEFDASDEEAVKREIMKGRAANKRFDQAAALKKQAEQAFEMLKDPKTLRQILADPRVGIDVQQMAEDIVWEHIERQRLEAEWAKDPAAKQRWEDERELKSRREADKTAGEKAKEQKHTEDVQRHQAAYEQKIIKALDTGGIPKTEAAVARMADYLMTAAEHGIDLSPEELVQQVRRDYLRDISHVLGGASGEQLMEFLGEENAKKLREADLKRLKNPQGNPFPARTSPKPTSTPAPREQRKAGSEWKQDLIKDFLNRKR
jgi:hypothetical protein